MVEKMIGLTFSYNNVYEVVVDNSNPYRNIVIDAMWMNQGYTSQCPIVDEEPNADTTKFFLSFERLWWIIMEWVHNHSKLSVAAHVFTIKSNHGLSEAGYDIIVE
jgi:hypothetical protein